MKSYTKTYLNYFGYALDDFIPCEVCGSRAVDIHHIECKGMGGSKLKDDIENIMALCREHHVEYGDKKKYIDFLKGIHNQRLQNK
jgi:hypothetical protein